MSTALRLARRMLTAVLLSAAISVGPVAFPPPATAATARTPAGVAAPLNAGIHLTPESGPAGTEVAVGGQGFEVCDSVTITFDGGHAVPGTVYVPEISGSITVPEGTPAGVHSIEASCDEDPDTGDYYVGSASFTVTGEGGGTTTPTRPRPSRSAPTADRSETRSTPGAGASTGAPPKPSTCTCSAGPSSRPASR
ncbi:hypothetical protein RGF97_08950 [Streptomyces roseicoloratus]|uniref:IPT/TIG domain-containing protein n=1 Tax=Streptomyces roseicoloratus TaxID=2508722 RepID=A0ABY9RTD1_9ACTN|nr:hypothetical protein [Streptomyces roseicoloratus]WMX44959.1 hypothetical protein RGF97_08950 [Streptomyces roseicoloratus]